LGLVRQINPYKTRSLIYYFNNAGACLTEFRQNFPNLN
jgi:hypothetical protein